MARTNIAISSPRAFTHQGGPAFVSSPEKELRRTVMTCMLWEDTLYEGKESVARRLAALIPKVRPEAVASLAIEARSQMQLRHAPLFLIRELARRKGAGSLVAATLPEIIQRADELAEFVALYWKEKRQPLSAGVKRGLASAFRKFSAYSLAKYNRDNVVKLRDVLFLTHAKPKDEEQAIVWKQLIDGTLEPPDTWEVELSAGKAKKDTFERLLREDKLGGLAVLRNLRNMLQAGVDQQLIRERLSAGISRALPFRFITAARYAPVLEPDIEVAMLAAVDQNAQLPGRTGLLIDVSGSMDAAISAKSEVNRIEAASGLAILLREIAEYVSVATFSQSVVVVPPRRGFALRDSIDKSQEHGGTYLKGASEALRSAPPESGWQKLDRVIVITDEQSQDGMAAAFTKYAYIVNVAPYQNGVGDDQGWHKISGWSERVIDYIREYEAE